MRTALFLLCLIGNTILYMACGDDPVVTTAYLTGTVTGKVKITNEYGALLNDLSGSTVQLIGTKIYTTTTTADGTFTFEKVDQGIYNLSVSAKNHLPTSLKQIQFVGNGTMDLGELYLARNWFNNATPISVSIVDEKGNFIYDSIGLVLTISNNKGFSMTFNNRMNIYIDSMAEGTYWAKVEKSGYIHDSTTFKCYRVSQQVKMTVFKPSFNAPLIIDPPEFNYGIQEKGSRVDSILDVKFRVTIDKDWDSKTEISSDFLESPSDSNKYNGNMNVKKNTSSELILSTKFLQNVGHGTWENYSTGKFYSTLKKQFYILLRKKVSSFSSEHRNYRFPNGLTMYSSQIIPFTIP